MTEARKALLSQTLEQRFPMGQVDVDLVLPAYVMDLSRFAREVESGVGTVSDIVWPAEQVLAQTLLQRKDLWQARGLCEIGAGLGLAGIAAAKAGAPRVLLNDRDHLVLELATRSAERNNVAQLVSTSAFDWADQKAWPKPFGGLTAGADVLYDKEVVRPLVDLIVHFGGSALLVEPDNVERRQLGSVPYFKDVLSSQGLALTMESYLNPAQPSSPMLIISVNKVIEVA